MVPGSATPMGTVAPGGVSGSHRPSVELTVASVGPYALNMGRPRAHRLTSSAETRSVPASSVAPAGRVQSAGMAASNAGGRIIMVTPCSWA
ncbi:hypothetical protein GCM10027087_48840 [Paractinoplanes abujensis]